MSLRPLRAEEATVLAGAVLGEARLSRDLEQYVAERAGGNPFFVEEMLRALQETGGLETRDGRVYLAAGAADPCHPRSRRYCWPDWIAWRLTLGAWPRSRALSVGVSPCACWPGC